MRAPQASGVVLLVAAAIALTWASLAPSTYAWLRSPPAAFLIDDVLMTVFFFVAGLEIRGELETGSLSDARRAALPIVAALGGMIVPGAIYLLMAPRASSAGWAIPTATDIAFALGVLSLLGSRVPAALRALLLALAIVDDLGAIVLVALFYASGVWLPGLIAAPLALAVRRMARHRSASLVAWIAALLVWLAVASSGVHPTIAGAAIGLATPPREVASLDRLRLFVALFIMPVFALAHAGVHVAALPTEATEVGVIVAVSVGLAIGKPLGVLVAAWVAVRLRIAALPPGIGVREMIVLGATSGIGFTMSLLIGSLAFAHASLRDAATLGVLTGSGVAALASLALGRALLSRT